MPMVQWGTRRADNGALKSRGLQVICYLVSTISAYQKQCEPGVPVLAEKSYGKN